MLTQTWCRYHAHAHTQRGDGLFGGLIVHNPMRNEGDIFSYDKELLLMIGDWYHKPSQKALDFFMSASSTGNEVCTCTHAMYSHIGATADHLQACSRLSSHQRTGLL